MLSEMTPFFTLDVLSTFMIVMLITTVILMDKHTDVCINLRLFTCGASCDNVHSSYKLVLNLRSALMLDDFSLAGRATQHLCFSLVFNGSQDRSQADDVLDNPSNYCC